MSVARVYRTASPYYGSELFDTDFEQSADTMYLANINHPPTKLTRASHTSWTFSSITFQSTLSVPAGFAVTASYTNTDSANSGAANDPRTSRYEITAFDPVSGQESRPCAAISVSNSLNLIRNHNSLTWTAVSGLTYRIYKSDITSDFGYIGSSSTGAFTDDNIGPDYSDGPPQAYNPFPTSDDYPSTVAFFQQRLGWARSNNHPNAMWFSRSGEYENMDVSSPLKASDSVSFALLAGKVNAVNQMVAMSSLLALTSDSVFAISGGSAGFLSPTTIVTQRQNGRGSSRLRPIVIDNVTFYQVSIGCAIRTLGYEFAIDGYNSNDVTVFSPHLFRGFTIISWAYTAEPLSIIWAVRSDGVLLTFTWQQEQQVWGWTECTTDGTVESVCTIAENGEDRLYLTIRRTINGVSRLFIERMASARWDAVEHSCFMDAAVTYSFDTPQTVLRNLDHLEGKAVVALADGAVVTGLTVSGGMVTLSDAASYVTVGLPFTATIETLPLAQNTPAGWTLAKPQQVSRVDLRVLNSRGVYAGPSVDQLNECKPRSTEPFGSPPSLHTGMVEAIMPPKIRSGARGDAGVTVVIQSVDPLPLTLTAVLYDPAVSQ